MVSAADAAYRPRWTREQFHRAFEIGLLTSDAPVELIAGEVLAIDTTEPEHQVALARAYCALAGAVGATYEVRNQRPLALGTDGEPKPDIAVVQESDEEYDESYPTQLDTRLVMEISAATLPLDQGRKAAYYAAAGIAEYWVLNLKQRQVEIHRNPHADASAEWGFAYDAPRIVRDNQFVAAGIAPDAMIPVADLLPPFPRDTLEFHFHLTPLDEIAAWDEEKPTLHWFGLTDGWFWITVGDQELFRYSDAVRLYWQSQEGIELSPIPYDDYPVAHYWEEIQDMLRTVLEPLPDDFAVRVADAEGWAAWQETARAWRHRHPKNDEAADRVYQTATSWWTARTWNVEHLRYPPRLWMWRYDETVFVRWDNREARVQGLPVWSTDAGEAAFSLAEFVDAVRSFSLRFLDAMQERIDTLRTQNPRPDVTIDLELLQQAQDYQRNLREPVKRQHEQQGVSYWGNVRAAMETITSDASTQQNTSAMPPIRRKYSRIGKRTPNR